MPCRPSAGDECHVPLTEPCQADRRVSFTGHLHVADDGLARREHRPPVTYHLSTQRLGHGQAGQLDRQRRAPGEIQMAPSDLIQGARRFEQALWRLRQPACRQIEDQVDAAGRRSTAERRQIRILNIARIQTSCRSLQRHDREHRTGVAGRSSGRGSRSDDTLRSVAEIACRNVVGLSTDVDLRPRCAIKVTAAGSESTRRRDRRRCSRHRQWTTRQRQGRWPRPASNIELTTVRRRYAMHAASSRSSSKLVRAGS